MKKKKKAADIVIDGSTLEKRRDQRAAQLEQFLWELTPEDRQGVVGYVNQWTKDEGVKVKPASQSLYNLDADQKQVRDYQEQHTFAAPAVIKRTTEQRIDSMARRLSTAPPGQVEAILKEIEAEYWKEGLPVTQEDLRTVASHFLNRTERKK